MRLEGDYWTPLRAALAASVAEGLTFPIDSVKTTLQLSRTVGGWDAKKHVVVDMIQRRGISGIYSGCSAAVLRHIPYTGCRIATFEMLRRHFFGSDPTIPQTLFMGFMAGGLGQCIAAPFDVVKIRMIADASKESHLRRYHGVFDAFNTIRLEEGIKGMYRGTSVAVQRAALVNLGELSTYSIVKKHLLSRSFSEEDARVHVISSLCSWFVSSFISTPADVVKSRMMNDSDKRFSSSLKCLLDCLQKEGLPGIFKGFFATWLRLGPWQMAFWLTYESIQ